jgi:Arc/MetJ family transcription regulator
MRTTMNIDDDLLAKARRFTGIKEKTALVHAGLEALIQREAARRLAALGGTMKDIAVPPRRRPDFRALQNRRKKAG